jgi:hypothetical protein
MNLTLTLPLTDDDKDRALESAKLSPMPPGTIQYAQCFTDDVEAVAARLWAVLGRYGAALLGPASSGTIEVEPLPAELRGRLTPGTTAISFAVDDLDERVAACLAAGLDVTVPLGGAAVLPYAVVAVAGLEFELVATGS